jgi:hypothetical protein
MELALSSLKLSSAELNPACLHHARRKNLSHNHSYFAAHLQSIAARAARISEMIKRTFPDFSKES